MAPVKKIMHSTNKLSNIGSARHEVKAQNTT